MSTFSKAHTEAGGPICPLCYQSCEYLVEKPKTRLPDLPETVMCSACGWTGTHIRIVWSGEIPK